MATFLSTLLRRFKNPFPGGSGRGDPTLRGLLVIAWITVALIGVGRIAVVGPGARAAGQPSERPSAAVLRRLNPTDDQRKGIADDGVPTDTLHLVKPFPAEGENLSGDNQVAIVGTRLSRPLIVQVLDGREHPAEGVPVHYLVIGESGELASETTSAIPETSPPSPLTTGPDGYAVLEGVWVDAEGAYKAVFYLNADNPDAGSRLTYRFEGRSPSWFNWMVVGLAGGLALFLLGAKLTGEGLGRLAGARVRETMARLDTHPVAGVGVGAAMTFLTQSSSASTTMFASFASANTLKTRQALPLIYGSAIGTTITVQLLAFDVYRYALLAVVAGVGIQLLVKRSHRMVAVGQSLLGFGLIFHGMHVMVMAVDPLRRLPWLSHALFAIKDYPGWALVISMAFTACVHSSAAVLGLVLALASQGLITPVGAVPLIFGANIGTTATALVASMGLSREARRVAIAHLLFKVLGVAIFLPLMGVLAWAGTGVAAFFQGAAQPLTGGEVARAIANIHTLFNVAIAVIALPFSSQLEILVRKIIPPKGDEGEGKLKYLDLPVLTSPVLVYGAALREISRMGRFVEEQTKAAHDALFVGDESRIDYIHRRDDKVDNLQRNITRYLTEMMRRSESPDETNRLLGLVQVVNDIENIGDLFDKNIAALAQKMILNGIRFAPDNEKDLKEFYLRVAADLSTLFVALSTGDRETARSVRSHRVPLAEFSQKLLIKHLTGLQAAGAANLEASSVFVDLINYLQGIEFHIYRIAGISAGDITYHADDAAQS